jgi:hypothetical protein
LDYRWHVPGGKLHPDVKATQLGEQEETVTGWMTEELGLDSE